MDEWGAVRGRVYLCPRLKNSQLLHGGGALSVQLTRRSLASLNFVQRGNKQIMHPTEIIEIADNTASNPCAAHLGKEQWKLPCAE